MFYEQSSIKAFLQCASCTQTFDEPRILPCWNTVCSACLETLVKITDKNDNSFKCSMCQGRHNNADFPVNRSLKGLMNTSPAELFRSNLVEVQQNNPTGTFYFPDDIRQSERNKGKYYCLSDTKWQIIREDNGQITLVQYFRSIILFF